MLFGSRHVGLASVLVLAVALPQCDGEVTAGGNHDGGTSVTKDGSVSEGEAADVAKAACPAPSSFFGPSPVPCTAAYFHMTCPATGYCGMVADCQCQQGSFGEWACGGHACGSGTGTADDAGTDGGISSCSATCDTECMGDPACINECEGSCTMR
jgi:hypothetical protein